MNLLADSAGRGQIITIAVLCVAACIFTLINVILVFSLHRQNKALAAKKNNQSEAVGQAIGQANEQANEQPVEQENEAKEAE